MVFRENSNSDAPDISTQRTFIVGSLIKPVQDVHCLFHSIEALNGLLHSCGVFDSLCLPSFVCESLCLIEPLDFLSEGRQVLTLEPLRAPLTAVRVS